MGKQIFMVWILLCLLVGGLSLQVGAQSVDTLTVEGGTGVQLEGEMVSSAVLARAGQTLTCTPGKSLAQSGQTLLLSLDVKGQDACATITVTLDFTGTDTVMTYYAPVQWSRIYMPVVCDGTLNSVSIQVQSGNLLLAQVTAENKDSTPIDQLKQQSGMWMLEDFTDITLDVDQGVRSVGDNQAVYDAAGATTSETVDLVLSSCGNFIYSVGGGRLTVTDVSDPNQPVVRSVYSNPLYPTHYGNTRQICLLPGRGSAGDAVIFTCRISGVFIVDVSDPDAPVEIAHYDSLEMATGLAVYDKYAFVCNRNYGVEIVDISDLSNPFHIRHIGRSGEVQSCDVVNGILYCGLYNKNQVVMYDVTNLASPKKLGVAQLNGRGDDMAVAKIGDRTYLFAGTGHHSVANISTGSSLANLNYGQGNGLDIFDVTDPTAPVLMSVSKIDGRFNHSLCDYWGAEVAEHNGRYYAYLVSTYNGAYVFDVTDPVAPVRLAHVAIGVDKSSGYFASLGHTSTIYDVIFPYDPESYKQAPVGALAVSEGELYIAGVYSDLYICQADWTHDQLQQEEAAQIKTTTAYYDNALSDVRPGGQTYAVAGHGQYLYVASGDQGILIYNKSMELVKTIPVTDICYDLYIQNGLLYCAEGRNGLVIYEISDDGLALTQQKHYVSTWDLVTAVRPSATGKFVALHVGALRGEIVDVSRETPLVMVRANTRTQAYHHNVEITANGRYVVFWGALGNEVWYDFGPNDSYTVPQQLSISPFTSRASAYGGYGAYKGNQIILTRDNGYTYYDPTAVTAQQVYDQIDNHKIRPVAGYGATAKTNIYGRGFVYENLLISCDRIYGRLYITDISDIDNPVLLRSWTGFKGHPDIPTVIDGVLYIPMGYDGIMVYDLQELLQAHEHCACAGSGIHSSCETVQWTPISEALAQVGLSAANADFGKLPSGNYYLDCDVVVSGISNIGAISGISTQPAVTKAISICLNGRKITTSTSRVFGKLFMGSGLTIADCSGVSTADGSRSYTGTVYGGTAAYGQVIYTNAGSRLNIYGGNFTSLNQATGGGVFAIACDNCGDQNGDGVYDATDKNSCADPAVCNLYGGYIYGGSANNGGNMILYHNAVLNQYGGCISGGKATAAGGNIMVSGAGTVNLKGGSIADGQANLAGNVQIGGNCTLTMTGGTISGGRSTSQGGNLIVYGTVNLNGGTVCDGEAGSYAGNIYVAGKMSLYKGTVSGGIANNYGGNIHVGGTFYMHNGSLSHGIATKEYGGNLLVGSAGQAYVYGGTIQSGQAANYGGNIHVLGLMYLCGSTVSEGNAKYGGNISVYNKGILSTMLSGNTKSPLVVEKGTAQLGQNLYIGHSTNVPTVNMRHGTYRDGSVYADNNSKLTLTQNPRIQCLQTGDAAVVTLGAMTQGASLGLDMQQGSLLQLSDNAVVDMTVLTAGFLNMSGFTLTGNVDGEGTLYGKDSATDGYECSAMGRVIGQVSCQVAGEFVREGRYMAISDAEGYSFHRFYLGVTALSLRPYVTGFGYKAEFYGDRMVQQQLQSIGYSLWLREDWVVTRSTDSFRNVLTLHLKNFDVDGYGTAPVSCQVFMRCKDGTVLTSEVHSYSLQQAVEAVAANRNAYSAVQLQAVRDMIGRYPVMEQWNVKQLLA